MTDVSITLVWWSWNFQKNKSTYRIEHESLIKTKFHLQNYELILGGCTAILILGSKNTSDLYIVRRRKSFVWNVSLMITALPNITDKLPMRWPTLILTYASADNLTMSRPTVDRLQADCRPTISSPLINDSRPMRWRLRWWDRIPYMYMYFSHLLVTVIVISCTLHIPRQKWMSVNLPTLRALRSNSSECPSRIASGGRISTKCFWTSGKVVVTFSSISAVIPLNLKNNNHTCKKSENQNLRLLNAWR